MTESWTQFAEPLTLAWLVVGTTLGVVVGAVPGLTGAMLIRFEIFRIEDGAIVGGTLEQKIAHNEFLTTAAEYADFELRLQFRLKGANTNAGHRA